MALSKTGGKARYTVTLTASNVERFRRLADDLGLPKSIMNLAFDDSLVEISNLFQTAKDRGGKFGVGDLVKLMADKVAEAVEQEVKTHEDKKKRNPNSKSA